MSIKEKAKALESYTIDLRREFHMHPELSHEETFTVKRICEELEKCGLPYEHVGLNNVVALLDTGRPGKTLAIRADIDALPVEEVVDVPFKSQIPGKMHACGHDAHTAILLTAAQIIVEEKENMNGKVYLCFQAAEEIGRGADEIVAYLKAQGGVDQVIGTHISGGDEPGTINLPDGPLMAGAWGFEIEVKGVGGHGSRPDKAVDPIKPACAILLAIAAIPAQQHDPFDTCVVSPCLFQAGTKNNIIPDTARIAGNIRFFKYGDGDKIVDAIRLQAENIAKAYGATATVVSEVMSPSPVINDPACAAFGREIAQEVGLELAPPKNPTMGSDNYAEFLAEFPGFYCDTGAHSSRPGTSGNHHNATFDLDESAFCKVVEFFATYAARYLGE